MTQSTDISISAKSTRLEAVGRLALAVAHELNNLLTVINGSCEVALASRSNQITVGELKEIQRAGRQAVALTRSLMAFGRPHNGTCCFDLNGFILDRADTFRRVLPNEITLTTRPASTPCNVEAAPDGLERVLLNLVLNARDAMPDGGELVIQVKPVPLKVAGTVAEVSFHGGMVLLEVSDTGSGIAPENLPYVFDDFFTTKAPGRGTGLGLALVREIVRDLGGEIHITSQPGIGTSFGIYLEFAENSGASQSRPVAQSMAA